MCLWDSGGESPLLAAGLAEVSWDGQCEVDYADYTRPVAKTVLLQLPVSLLFYLESPLVIVAHLS